MKEIEKILQAISEENGGWSDDDVAAAKAELEILRGVRPVLNWTREDVALPRIAQPILLAHPRQSGDFWDLAIGKLLVKHEDVCPIPRPRGHRWPTDWWWEVNRGGSAQSNPWLVTGNNYWAALDAIPLPPGAAHARDRSYHYLIQTAKAFVGQGEKE